MRHQTIFEYQNQKLSDLGTYYLPIVCFKFGKKNRVKRISECNLMYINKHNMIINKTHLQFMYI